MCMYVCVCIYIYICIVAAPACVRPLRALLGLRLGHQEDAGPGGNCLFNF